MGGNTGVLVLTSLTGSCIRVNLHILCSSFDPHFFSRSDATGARENIVILHRRFRICYRQKPISRKEEVAAET